MAKKSRKKGRRYRGRTAASAKHRQESGAAYGYLNLPSGVAVYKEEPSKKGKAVSLDILEYKVEESRHPDEKYFDDDNRYWTRPFQAHRNIGPNQEAVVCLTSIGKKCPICIARTEILRSEDGSKEDARDLKPQKRHLYYVIPRNHADFEEVPHIWNIAKGNFQKQLDIELQTDEEYEDFPMLDGGLTIKVRFSKESFGGNEYAEADRIDFKERDEAIDEDILESMPDLRKVLTILSYKELDDLFLGIDEEDEDDPDEESLKAKEEPEPDDDEDDDDEDDDEEDDEEDEEDEDEEDEPEPPAKKDKKKGKNKKENPHPKSKGKKKGKSKCPHGHKFGKDVDEHTECEDCKLWDDCLEASD